MKRLIYLLILSMQLLATGAAGQITLPAYQGAQAVSIDPDVRAYIVRWEAAKGTAMPTVVRDSLNAVVLRWKRAGTYAKIVAWYPNYGGTAATHALEFRNVYNATNVGGPTHNASGVATNGTSSYVLTGVPNTALGSNPGIFLYGTFNSNAYLAGSYGISGGACYLYQSGTNSIYFNSPDELAANQSTGVDGSASGFKSAIRYPTNQTSYLCATLNEQKTTTTLAAVRGDYGNTYGALRRQDNGTITNFSAATFSTVMFTNGATVTDQWILRTGIINLNNLMGR